MGGASISKSSMAIAEIVGVVLERIGNKIKRGKQVNQMSGKRIFSASKVGKARSPENYWDGKVALKNASPPWRDCAAREYGRVN